MKHTLVVLAAMLAVTGTAASAVRPYWHVVKTARANSTTSMTDLDVTVRHPGQLAVRATGHVTGNAFGWVCTRGYQVTSDTREVDKPGLFVLTRVRGTASCEVNASIVGDGPIRLQILKH